ncbi:Vascular endothelial growth factor receptor 3-like protein, partial [Leptotrombidium deliense]
MKAICFAFVTLFTSVFAINVFNPPQLQILSSNVSYAASERGKTIDVQNGSDLKLRCVGNSPITWRFPVQENNKEINSTDFLEKSGNETIFTTDLILSDLVFSQTGLYTCFYNDSNDDSLSDSVYVFVNDKHNLHIEFNHDIDYWYPSKPIKIPCLPTYSYANVTFQYSQMDSEERMNLTVDEDKGITYDPTSGLEIQKENVDVSRRYYCTYHVHSLSTENSFVIIMGSVSDSDVYVSMELLSRTPILVNDTLEFVCTVDSSKAKQLSIDFTSPVTDANLTISEITNETLSLNMIQFYRYSRRMIVENVTTAYQGVYYCNVSHSDKIIAGEFHTVSIYDESLQIIDDVSTDVDLNKNIVRKAGENINIEFTVKSKFQVQLSDLSLLKDGKVVSKEKQRALLKMKGNKILVEMLDMSMKKSGMYELIVYGNRKSINRKFNVEVKSLSIESASNVYDRNEMFTIICTASGNPIPEIVAFFYPCKGNRNCTDKKHRRYVTKFTTVLTGNNELYSYNVTVENRTRTLEIRGDAQQSGWYECLATSISGNEYARLRIN